MPQKKQMTREKIIEGALSLVRKEGIEAVNARRVAAHLGISTQPIYDSFSSMKELVSAVGEAAYGYYLSKIAKEVESGKYPPYKASGMAYTRFAKEERQLFILLFLRDRSGEPVERTLDDFDNKIIEIIMKNGGLDREYAYRLHMHMWTVVHGIATMIATSFYPWEEEKISEALTDTYQGVRAYLIQQSKEKKNERD